MKHKKSNIDTVEILQNPIKSLRLKMVAHPLKMVSKTRVSFFINKIFIQLIFFNALWNLSFKGIRGSYFYITHFYKAKRTSLILLFLKIVHIYIYYNISLLKMRKRCHFRSGL